jgi:arginine decarboxylase
MGGLIMSGVEPVWMQPEVDEDLHLDHTVTPETVRATLDEHPDVRAVYVVSPTYYGVAADLVGIAGSPTNAASRCWSTRPGGRTFTSIPTLPIDALEAGADLHQLDAQDARQPLANGDAAPKSERVRVDRLKAVVKLFLSTSPNLVLVASLDVARKQMATEGSALLSRTIELANDTRRRLNEIPGIYCFGEEGRAGRRLRSRSDEDHDHRQRTRLHGLRSRRDPAPALQRAVRAGRPLQLLGALHDRDDAARRPTARPRRQGAVARGPADRRLLAVRRARAPAENRNVRAARIPPIRMNPRDAFLPIPSSCRFKESAGRICAEVITPYPPGIPVISPGEEITPEIVAYLDSSEGRRPDAGSLRFGTSAIRVVRGVMGEFFISTGRPKKHNGHSRRRDNRRRPNL